MSVSDSVRERIETTIAAHPVVLFMKGTRDQPQCGFSATVVGILGDIGPDYHTINVLEDAEIREGIKAFSNWPTIPQLYIDREFVGGCDVIQQMYTSGDLHRSLGLEPVAFTPPEITISDSAAKVMREVLDEHDGLAAHLRIDAQWDHQFSVAPAKGHEVKVASNGVEILLDLESARRAPGLVIDMADTDQGAGFDIQNPNAPKPVAQMPVEELKALIDSGETVHLFDVRQVAEREIASIVGSRLLDEETVKFIESLDRNTRLIFQCHSGQRSQSAAEHFRAQGFSHVCNLAGGIDAWSQRIDADVPRY